MDDLSWAGPKKRRHTLKRKSRSEHASRLAARDKLTKYKHVYERGHIVTYKQEIKGGPWHKVKLKRQNYRDLAISRRNLKMSRTKRSR